VHYTPLLFFVVTPMSWLQLKIETTKADAPQYEALLEEVGAAAVLMEDSADQPLLEPPPGATPLWDATRVIGVFTVDSEIDAVIDYLEAQLGHKLPEHRVEVLEDKDWVRAWMDHYHPMQFGRRLWVVPSWTPPPVPDAINLLLDPGLAFAGQPRTRRQNRHRLRLWLRHSRRRRPAAGGKRGLLRG
jgi:ribosomal protein L11 methyltransferase